MQDGPKPLNRIEMGAVWRQLDQMDTASCPSEEGSDIGTFVVGSVVPDHVDDEFILIVGLNFGLQLHATHVIGAIKGVSKVSRFSAP